jgi:hypothetical protein
MFHNTFVDVLFYWSGEIKTTAKKNQAGGRFNGRKYLGLLIHTFLTCSLQVKKLTRKIQIIHTT